jgi:lysozyme family protein
METVWDFDGDGKTERDPNDPGGTTKWGVDQASHPGVDVSTLDLDQAVKIYEEELIRHNFYLLPSSYGFPVYECGVNMGYRTAIKMFQEVVGVYQDGILGPVTIKEAEKYGSTVLRLKFHSARVERYRQLASNNHRLEKFLRGWLNRADISLRLAEALAFYDV